MVGAGGVVIKLTEEIRYKAKPKGLGLGSRYRIPHMLVGFDTETIEGQPYTCQFSDTTGGRELIECHGQAEVVRAAIASYLKAAPPKSFIVMAAWYLRFDIQVMFRDVPEIFTGLGELAHEDEQGVDHRGSTNWPVIFDILRWEGRSMLILDAWRYFQGSLAGTCAALNLPIQKLERPACVVENREPKEDEREEFARYAMVDADAVLGVLKHIDSLWSFEDVGPCISLAHMAGRVFRKNYTVRDGKARGLDSPDVFSQREGLAAYHGGRNSFRAESLPCVVEDATLYDVRSMYPSICTYELPSFFGGRWISDTRVKRGVRGRDIEPAGIYRVAGDLVAGDAPAYRLLMDADGAYLKPGPFNISVTGFELRTALDFHMILNPVVLGFYWEVGTEKRHPFKEFFTDVYKKKEEHRGKNTLKYLYYKNLGNSLTGKFVSTIPQREEDSELIYRVPGLLFNPSIGALITGAGRARLFRAEVKADSIHGATDSIVVPPWGKPPDGVGPGLGQWEEVCRGDFVAARNKLYAFLGKKKGNFTGEKDGGLVYQGKPIIKYALHAFHGTVFQFLDAVFGGQRQYRYRRMTQLRESQKRRGITPLTMQEFESTLDFGGKYAGKA